MITGLLCGVSYHRMVYREPKVLALMKLFQRINIDIFGFVGLACWHPLVKKLALWYEPHLKSYRQIMLERSTLGKALLECESYLEHIRASHTPPPPRVRLL